MSVFLRNSYGKWPEMAHVGSKIPNFAGGNPPDTHDFAFTKET